MIRFVEVIDLPLPPEEAFDAIADFSTAAEWDPSVKSALHTTSLPLRVGSRFRLDVDLLGRSQTYGYAITAFERPGRLVLEGGNAGTRLVDEITFVARGRGTRITYEVRCELMGPLRLAEPLVDLVLPVIGRRAADGLRRYGRRLLGRSRYQAALREDEAPLEAEPASRFVGHRTAAPTQSHQGGMAS